MYLKRIEMHGFKSFADRAVIELEKGITGIVGPNGCGKSNIADAVRWVLGEQSAKSLRGSHMADVIFNGSDARKPQNLAEVTLVFDNSDHYLQSEYEEIEITRRLYRENSEAEYCLNRQPCRLKDIVELVTDTGLGRDSLSIISQGNISAFADARPEERRATFEEAAGVAKYKKRKDEALRRLERATANLSRVDDILLELEKQLLPLRHQKEKAVRYQQLEADLKDREISLLVHDITVLNEITTRRQKENDSRESALLEKKNQEILLTEQNEEALSQSDELDRQIASRQNELLKAMETLQQYRNRQAELEARDRYEIRQSRDELAAQAELLKKQLQTDIARYNDRVTRLTENQNQLNKKKDQRSELERTITQSRRDIEKLSLDLQMARANRALLAEQLENGSGYPAGVRAILAAKDSLSGYCGILGELVEITPGYEQAIDTALGANASDIVMKTSRDSRAAIAFLRENKAGRATFLPLDSLQIASVPGDILEVVSQEEAYLGLASDFVKCAAMYRPAVLARLGRIVIAKDLAGASRIAELTAMRYRVVTLPGDVVAVGGAMTGGAYRHDPRQSAAAKKRQLEQDSMQISAQEVTLQKARQELKQKENEAVDLNNELLSLQISKGRMEEEAREYRQRIAGQKQEYETLTHEKLGEMPLDDSLNDLMAAIGKAQQEVDEITRDIQNGRENRLRLMSERAQRDADLKTLRGEIRQLEAENNAFAIAHARDKERIAQALKRLNETYHCTYERALEIARPLEDWDAAKDEVVSLREEMSALGHVNIEAIAQYDEVFTRYQQLSEQKDDLLAAQDAILKAIAEMDEQMTTRFDDMFHKINTEFNNVFRRLFGGGRAALRYSSPDDLLSTGIDIDVQPPGKQVQNITLFSGGEKALIALSALFAILKARPVPLCILDEVEAALDQANVERFARFLKDFAKNTQFIVVTHRPGTMAQCDALYGATMQEKGVTRLVSVRLQDAEQLAE